MYPCASQVDSISWNFIVIMAGSVKAFQFFQKIHRIIGLYPAQPDEKQFTFNLRRTIFLFGNAQLALPTVIHAVVEAKSMFDFGMCSFIIITLVNVKSVYLLFDWQLEITRRFIETCEEFIAQSTCESIKLKSRLLISVIN